MRKKYLFLLWAFILCGMPAIGQSALVNGGFETGDLLGWNVGVKYNVDGNTWYQYSPNTEDGSFIKVNYPFDPFTNPYLPMPAVDLNPWYFPNVVPIEGNNFVGVPTNTTKLECPVIAPNGDIYLFAGYTTTYLYQNIYINEGDILSGRIAMGTTDWPLYRDRVWVEISNSYFSSIPLSLNIATARTGDYLYTGAGISPWLSWSWTVPGSGNYTISLNAYGDDDLESIGFFDGIKLYDVPEPSTILLLGSGSVGIMVFGRKKFKK